MRLCEATAQHAAELRPRTTAPGVVPTAGQSSRQPLAVRCSLWIENWDEGWTGAGSSVRWARGGGHGAAKGLQQRV